MQKIQLYIESQRVDLFEDESVKITDTIQNIKDPAKIFTTFSRQFTIPATKVNNQLFDHYYNFNIINGFDARKKVDAVIELNDLPFRIGKVALTGVELKNNKADSYKITFFGSTVDIKDLIGEDNLNLLPLSQFDQIYNNSELIFGLGKNPATNDVIVPLISHTQRLFYDSTDNTNNTGNLHFDATLSGLDITNTKYALRAKKIVEAIELKYNLNFVSTFFDLPVFNDLFLWLQRKSGNIGAQDQVPIYETVTSFWNPDNETFGYIENSTLDFGTDWIIDQSVACSNIIFYYMDTTVASGYQNVQYRFKIVYDNGDITYLPWKQGSSSNIQFPTDPSQNNYFSQCVNNYSGFTIFIQHLGTIQFSNIIIRADGPFQSGLIDQWSNSLTVINQTDFRISEQIPEMQVIDFLTGIFKMFNLTVYIDQDSNVRIQTLDDYYSTGIEYDITEFVDTSKSKIDNALPYRLVNFRYKKTDAFFAKFHNQIFNQEWGALNYTNNELLDGSLYKIELPFEHHKFERLVDATGALPTSIQWGWSVNESQQSYKGDPLLFYPINIRKGGGTISVVVTDKLVDNSANFISSPIALGSVAKLIVNNSETARAIVIGVENSTTLLLDSNIFTSIGQTYDVNDTLSLYDGVTHTGTTAYNVVSNSVSLLPSVSLENTNFRAELNEWNGSSEFTDTLFNDYYTEYISNAFNPKNRLTKVTAYLPLNIQYNYSLADIFIIKDNKYRINEITTDLKTGRSEIELLNIL
jgi:hypothetical protein